MSNKLIGYDANMTDGTDPAKMDALYQDDQYQVHRVRVPQMITLSLSKPSISAGGVDFATLNFSTSKSQVTVALTQGRDQTTVDVPLPGSLDITSDHTGTIQIDCTDLCETIYLEAK